MICIVKKVFFTSLLLTIYFLFSFLPGFLGFENRVNTISAVNTDVYEFSLNSGSNWTSITKSNTSFEENLQSLGQQTFNLKLYTPSFTNCPNQ